MLEEMQIERIGGVKPIKIDVRVIAATNRNLHQLIKDLKFREDLLSNVYHVIRETPELESIKKSLFNPIVEFTRLGYEISNSIDLQLNDNGITNAYYKSICIPDTVDEMYTVSLVVSSDEKDHIVSFNFNNTDKIRIVGPSESNINTTSYEKFLINGSKQFAANSSGVYNLSGNPYTSNHLKSIKVTSVYMLSSLLINKNKMLLIVDYNGQTFTILVFDESKSEPYTESLKSDVAWKLCTLSPDNSTLFFLGEAGDDKSQLYIYTTLTVTDKQNDIFNNNETMIPFKVKQIVALSNSKLLALDFTGNLFLIKTNYPEPVPLRHQEWIISQDSKIILGTNGWFALAAKQHLTMWQLGREGHVYPYSGAQSSLDISLVDVETLVATNDGRYLFGLPASKKPDRFYTWEFPRYAADSM